MSQELGANQIRGNITHKPDITSDTLLWVTSMVFRIYLTPALSLCSLGTNIVNVLVFWRMGLKDGATATFFVLSIADGCKGLLGVLLSTLSCLRYLGPPQLRRSAYSLHALILATGAIPSYASTFSTVVIAVVRCCSVAMPLRVKSVLTVRRQLLGILWLMATCIAVFSYGITCYRVFLRLDPRTNVTHIVLALTPDFIRQIQVFDQYRGVSFYGSFITVNICLVILIVSLRRSSNFRTGASGTASSEAEGGSSVNLALRKSDRRERQVVKTVVLVSIVFTVCNLPGLALSILRQALPGFRSVGHLHRSFDMLFIFVEAIAMVNACVNILVYIVSNTNYRRTLKKLFVSNENNDLKSFK